ncbi:uncharacterized protein LOC115215401 [Octopus sinensis]|uniref:Uncharacterized protein LOC115215401 n=1 Tax=Octopus sinensis TaxID=2607531 RepID=A0A6P7SQ78_9MOLL|nr:uncharacterized protein LOC115215401 [Octopus sinensis]
MSVPQRTVIPERSLESTFLEVVISIKQISSGKAPDRDAIPPEIYKHGGQKLFTKMHDLFINVWKVGRQHPYKKKGNRIVCDNHCGISLLSIASKILARLILDRVIKHVVNNIYPESQCGSPSSRGTIDMIFSLRQVTEKVREKNQELFLIFVDLTKAFDTVNQQAL